MRLRALRATHERRGMVDTNRGRMRGKLLSEYWIYVLPGVVMIGAFVPFGCLTDEQGRYLVEDYAISYAPSGSVLKFCQAKRKSEMKKALVLAKPYLDGPGSALAFAEAEAEGAAKLFGEKTILRGTNATETAFVKLAPDYDVRHLAWRG